MELHILRAEEIRALLPMHECIDAISDAMVAVSEGRAVLPLRNAMKMPGDIGMLGLMHGYLESTQSFGIKLVSLFPRNSGTEHSSHLGAMVVFETEHGYPVGLLDAAEITAIRTAAASGVATRLLARDDATTLAILGTGEQAKRHVEAMLAVKPFSQVHIWGRNLGKAAALARSTSDTYGIEASSYAAVAEAVRGADVVCTTTNAHEPILSYADIAPGTHLNVVGSSIPTTAEIDIDLVVQSRFYVDFKLSARNQAGELLRAIEAGKITFDHIVAEIGDVVAGRAPGRSSPEEITIYKSLGVAAQDLAAADLVLKKARIDGVGQQVRFP